MGFKLTENSYGKSVVRLTKVVRRGAWHDLLEMSCDIQLQGDFVPAYSQGDNTKVVATDSIKNTVYILAKETQFESIEHFAVVLAQHFVNTYAQVSKAVIEIEAPVWQRIDIAGRAHEHAFTSAASEMRICNVTFARGGEIELEAGFADLSVIKTTASGWANFVSDRYRTLKDTDDRIFATFVNARWKFIGIGHDYDGAYRFMRQAMLATFAQHHSFGVQHTLMAMGEAALKESPGVKSITITMPNKHRVLFDLSRFGLENDNEIFVSTEEPFGLISGTVTRD